MVAAQHTANKAVAHVCSHCFCYLGSIEQQVALRLLPGGDVAGERCVSVCPAAPPSRLISFALQPGWGRHAYQNALPSRLIRSCAEHPMLLLTAQGGVRRLLRPWVACTRACLWPAPSCHPPPRGGAGAYQDHDFLNRLASGAERLPHTDRFPLPQPACHTVVLMDIQSCFMRAQQIALYKYRECVLALS